MPRLPRAADSPSYPRGVAGRGRWAGRFLIVVGVVTAACGATPSATPAPPATPTTTATASPSASATPSAGPTGPFGPLPGTCGVQAAGSATTPRASIIDLRAESFADYDSLTFEFERGLPGSLVEQAEPPFRHDPSDLPMEVQGDAFYRVVLSGASIVDEEFQPVYEGPTDFLPGLPRIRHVSLAGDFEAVSTWVIGLEAPTCMAAKSVPENRLVIVFYGSP